MMRGRNIIVGILCIAFVFFGTSVSFGSNTDATSEVIAASTKKDEASTPGALNDYVTFLGLIEAEFGFGTDFEDNDFSEFAVSVELGVEVQLSELVSGFVLANYDTEDEDLVIDEAFITLGNPDSFPLVLTAGKYCMSFGGYKTNMIQDPLALEIGEINDIGLTLRGEYSGFYGEVFVFNGLGETEDDEDAINGFGLLLGLSYENDVISFDTGVSWVNTIASSGTISDLIEDKGLDVVRDQVGGLNIYAYANVGDFGFLAEFLTALDSFDESEISFNGTGAEPKAWNVEINYTKTIYEKETVWALGYQQTEESVDLELPESRVVGAVSVDLGSGIALSLEYFYDQDYNIEDGGSGEDAQTGTILLSYEW